MRQNRAHETRPGSATERPRGLFESRVHVAQRRRDRQIDQRIVRCGDDQERAAEILQARAQRHPGVAGDERGHSEGRYDQHRPHPLSRHRGALEHVGGGGPERPAQTVEAATSASVLKSKPPDQGPEKHCRSMLDSDVRGLDKRRKERRHDEQRRDGCRREEPKRRSRGYGARAGHSRPASRRRSAAPLSSPRVEMLICGGLSSWNGFRTGLAATPGRSGYSKLTFP